MGNNRRTQQQRADNLAAAQVLITLQSTPVIFISSSSVQETSQDHQSSIPDGQSSDRQPVIPQIPTTASANGALNSPHLHTHSPFCRSRDDNISNDNVEHRSVALSLLNMHAADRARNRSIIQNHINLLAIGGRSGIQSRGVAVRRQGEGSVNEELAQTNILTDSGGRIEGDWEETRDEETEEEEEGDEREDDDDDEEYWATSPKAHRPSARGVKKGIRKSQKARHGTPRQYQRFNVRDDKARFVKK